MINEKDIDTIVDKRNKGFSTNIYYVASNAELPDISSSRSLKESAHEFSLIEYNIIGVRNALHEYENYKLYKDDYAIKTFKNIIVSDHMIDYIEYRYKENVDYGGCSCNPRIYDSEIATYYSNGDVVVRTIPSICGNPKVTNNPTFLGKRIDIASDLFVKQYNWKYKLIEDSVIEGSIPYYRYTDYYILYINGWHLKTYPLINVTEQNQFFLDPADAYEYLKQIRS